MNKVYLGEVEVANNSSGGGGESFDPTDINASISDISTRVQTLEFNSLVSDDISTFIEIDDVLKYTYNKAHIDASFAAIPDSGDPFDPTDINSSINDISTRVDNISNRVQTLEYNSLVSDDISTFIEIDDVLKYTYNKAHIDASFAAISGGGGSSFDPTDINSSISDISTRVDNISTRVDNISTRVQTLEFNSLDSDDISTFIEIGDVLNYTYNKAHIDASINAITPNFVVMSEADYEHITPNPSTLYFLT